MTELKGLIVSVYTDTPTQPMNVLVIGEGIPEIFSNQGRDLPVVKLVKGNINNTAKIVPVHEDGNEIQGTMFGGSFVTTSDSRFRRAVEVITGSVFFGAVPLHNRIENNLGAKHVPDTKTDTYLKKSQDAMKRLREELLDVDLEVPSYIEELIYDV